MHVSKLQTPQIPHNYKISQMIFTRQFDTSVETRQEDVRVLPLVVHVQTIAKTFLHLFLHPYRGLEQICPSQFVYI